VTCFLTDNKSSIIEDYDASKIECDGYFPIHECEVAGVSEGSAVILERQFGKGTVVITSIHEYPSRQFLIRFCQSGTQTLF
jgi:hypothetical protein